MKKSKTLALTMASLLLAGSLTGCHIDKEQLEQIKATLSDDELARIVEILDSHGIVITDDGVDIPENVLKPVVSRPSNVAALYGAPPVFNNENRSK